jgi:ribosome biogenesis protein MAK21
MCLAAHGPSLPHVFASDFGRLSNFLLELLASLDQTFNNLRRASQSHIGPNTTPPTMGQKRKPVAAQADKQSHPPKKPRQENKREEKAKLIFAPRPEWHTAELPPISIDEDAPSVLPQRAFDDLYKYATELLTAENAAYNGGQLAGSSSHKFLSTIMANGTLEDKISALTLLVQESPLHTTKAFENLLALSKKKSRNQALMAVAALKDMLGQGVVLPGDRKLKAFGKQPALASVLQGQGARWNAGQPLPGGLQKIHLVVWAYEDWLKKTYFELLQVLESWCGDEVEFARSRALTYVFDLLKDKPEQEENLLRLLVNKLGDTDRKIASRVSYLLLQLQTTHPAMKMVITNSIEADSLFRPGQSQHAKYYAIITLNQTILSQKEQGVANRLLDIYFSLFVQLLKPAERQAAKLKGHVIKDQRQQGGGGKPGKAAAKKLKAQEKVEESDQQLNDKLMAQVLTGVNRAFPFADTSDPTFERQIDTLFRVTHSANFNTAVQALMLLQQISSAKNYGADRFYRTLYESILDPRLIGSSKQVLYLNLLYKSLKADLNAKRVQAFIKRLLQTITMHEVSFVCGVLYLVSELEGTFPSIKTMITDPEYNEDDEEEHFVDAPEEGDERPAQDALPRINTVQYDARKRDPEHAHAERSCLWDLLPFIQHFHPSVSLFAEALLFQKKMPPKPDPTHYSLMHFLDRFVYRTARSKASAGQHGSSIMQPMGGSSAADLLVKPGESMRAGIPVNNEAFWNKKVENVAADEVFFHSYFNQAGTKKSRKQEKKDGKKPRSGDDSDDDEDRGEDEIWKAIVNSRPEVEGDDDDDDDLSMGDLEDAYSDSEEGSEGGMDLGGEGDDDDEEGGMMLDGGSEDDMDVPDFSEDDDDAFGDDDEVPFGILDDEPEEKEEEVPADSKKARNKKQREDRKKLKALPTFATAEDYAKLIGEDDDEDI